MILRIDRVVCPVLLAWLCFAAPASSAPPAADAASVALHAGNASNAVALATQALADPALMPRDRAHVLVDRGLAHGMLGEHDAALLDFTEAINGHALATPDQARALYDRGVTLDALGQTEDAVGDYSAAIRLDPRYAAALNNRGNAYRRLGRLAEATADYKASLAAGNAHVEYPNYGLGLIAEAQGNPALARSYYTAALSANPQFALAQERLTALATAPAAAPRVAPPPPPPPSTGDAPIVLHPPQEAAHLHPPRPPAPRPAGTPVTAPAPSLKPALEGTHAQTVQLGAWRNEADAAEAWNTFVGIAGNVLAGLSPQVVPVDLPGKGRYYRLRAGPVYDGADRLCATLIARKLVCIVVRD
jgi:tetratricopeptide (TPR) repeat protein